MADPSWNWEDIAALAATAAIGGSALAIAAQLAVALGAGAPGGLDSPPAYLATTVFYLLLIAAVGHWIARRTGWAALGVRAAAGRWYLALLPLLLLSLGLPAFVAGMLGSAADSAQLMLISGGEPLTFGRVLMLLPLVGLLVPCAEELVFRGVLQPLVGRHLGRAAIPLVALLFAVMHPIVAIMPALALLGLCCGMLRAASGSIVPGVVLHAAQNSLVLFLFLY
ncbi:MAG TPA: CPBP family intramembrane metalloprotease [Roseiflexaceae bacterium]|nr:CPBP family intramembrane metalloprotease [Roseiflexaceae bacterium]HMP42233.1 CPBP family intramembrane metalloprotease [Roseiflexaceae bacterium]